MLTQSRHFTSFDFDGLWRPETASIKRLDSENIGPNFVSFQNDIMFNQRSFSIFLRKLNLKVKSSKNLGE